MYCIHTYVLRAYYYLGHLYIQGSVATPWTTDWSFMFGRNVPKSPLGLEAYQRLFIRVLLVFPYGYSWGLTIHGSRSYGVTLFNPLISPFLVVPASRTRLSINWSSSEKSATDCTWDPTLLASGSYFPPAPELFLLFCASGSYIKATTWLILWSCSLRIHLVWPSAVRSSFSLLIAATGWLFTIGSLFFFGVTSQVALIYASRRIQSQDMDAAGSRPVFGSQELINETVGVLR